MSYTNYKDSNILFVGKIPSDWIVRSMRSLFTFGRGRVISNEEIADNEGEYPVYSSQTKNDGILGYIDTYDFKGEYVTWTTDGANAGTVFYREGKFNCTNVCGTIQPKKEGIVYLKLLPYYLNFATKEYVRYDINPKLMNNVMGDIPICFPESLEEQQQIVNYLDKKTAKIDATIAKNEELIELLEEKRVALINQVVTKGLNPDVELRDSGVEWIGEIPEHWDITKIRFLGSLQNGISKSSEYFGHGYPFISYGDVYNNDEIPKKIKGKSDTTISERVAYSVQKNDIFFTRTSETIDEVGITSLCTRTVENGTFSGFLIRFRLFKNIYINVKFLKFYLQSIAIRHYFAKMMVIVTRASLGQNLLNNLNVLLPPMDEQNQIANYLDKETSIIDKTISKIQKNISLLEEYKTSLIHHVVTGKIDVRGEEI